MTPTTTRQPSSLFCLLCCFLWLLVSLGACARPDARSTALTAQKLYKFKPLTFNTSSFVLFGLLRPAQAEKQAGPPAGTLHVYIEGDGLAWLSRTLPSNDPTPSNPVALTLARSDRSPGPVLYLARPCQYVEGDERRMCSQKYWTSARFAPEVVQSLNEAISEAMTLTHTSKVALIGFSGGGGLAALLAAQRSDVTFLGTVASNLDHASWTSLHNVSPLHGSLNPIDVAAQLKNLPQRHLSSPADSIVPPLLAQKFCQAIEKPEACEQTPGMKHDGSWEKVWRFDY